MQFHGEGCMSLHSQQLKSQTDMAKLFESPKTKHNKEHEKDKDNSVTKIKKSLSLCTSTNKSSIESNQSKCSSRPSQQNSRQISKSPSKGHPAKHNSSSNVATAPGLCKEQPVVLSSGESDHEVPLPSLQPKKKPEQKISVERELSTQPSNQSFQMKVSKTTISATSPLLEEVQKEKKVVPVKSACSSLPPIKKQQSINQTTKVLPSQVKSQKSLATQDKPPHQQPTHRPVTRAAAQAVKKVPATRILPPPRPTQDKPHQPPTRRPVTRAAAQVVKKVPATCILPPPRSAKPVTTHIVRPPPPPSFFSYTNPQPLPYRGHYHHDYHQDPYQHRYEYGGYSSSWGSQFTYSSSAHPLSTSYCAGYYDFSR